MQTLEITGMSCGGCVNSVAKIIVDTTGVKPEEIDVDLASGRAHIPKIDPTRLGELRDKLEAAGFGSRPVE